MGRVYFVLLATICICVSCNVERRQFDVQKYMERADFLMEENPDSAYSIMLDIDTVAISGIKPLHMQYILSKANAQNRTDRLVMALDEFMPALDYFREEGNVDEKMLACYLAGRICVMKQESPLAMEYFQQVLDIADETEGDFNYKTVYRTHTQMANLYHQQHAYQKAFDMCMAASRIALEAKDSLMALEAKQIAIRPLDLTGRYEDVIALSEECAREWEKQGMTVRAAHTRQMALPAYILCSMYDDAKRVIAEFEAKSGMFDDDGHIEKGWEIFYYKKGLLFAETGMLDRAEQEFRKILSGYNDLNSREAAYRGLLTVYSNCHKLDSVGKYALLYCETHDSVYKYMVAEDVAHIESMCNYERNRIMADRKDREASLLRASLYAIVLLVVLCVVLLALYLRQLRNKGAREKESLKMVYEKEKKDINSRFVDMKEQAARNERTIKELKDKLAVGGMSSDECEAFIHSVESEEGLIYKLKEKAHYNYKGEASLTDEEKSILLKYMEVKYTKCFDFLSEHRISNEETILAALMVTGFEDQEIRLLVNVPSSTAFANRKRRLSMKLFSQDTARLLRHKLLQLT